MTYYKSYNLYTDRETIDSIKEFMANGGHQILATLTYADHSLFAFIKDQPRHYWTISFDDEQASCLFKLGWGELINE